MIELHPLQGVFLVIWSSTYLVYQNLYTVITNGIIPSQADVRPINARQIYFYRPWYQVSRYERRWGLLLELTPAPKNTTPYIKAKRWRDEYWTQPHVGTAAFNLFGLDKQLDLIRFTDI